MKILISNDDGYLATGIIALTEALEQRLADVDGHELCRRLLAAWHRREIAAVLLFSPRTAETLVRLLIDYGLASHVDTTTAICVSEATATPCRRLDWRTICLAARPDREALIRALEGSIGIC